MAELTRRMVLGGLLAGTALPVWAEAPQISPRPAPRLVKGATAEPSTLIGAARLNGATGYVVAELASGRVLEQAGADQLMPPASVEKAITSLFALEKLGPDYRFSTKVMAVGVVSGGTLEGDLVLAGGGDPTLDSDSLGDLVAALAATGLRQVTGRFIAYAGALPAFERISADQPEQVGYNPGLSGLALNFNRVNFEWSKGGASLAMNARGERFVPDVHVAKMAVADRGQPIFTRRDDGGAERWTVARAALGNDGSRWLPVRHVAPYVADVFRTLCAAQGISLPVGEVVQAMPEGARLLVEHRSDDLTTILRSMLRFSTNITAETVGLMASGAASLRGSAAAMQEWAQERLGLQARFVDHSGLGSEARVTAGGMLRALLAAEKTPTGRVLRAILRETGLRDEAGREIKDSAVRVHAKSGTLNFVSGLAGFIEVPGGRDLAFAIFSADLARRAAIPMAEREEPKGNKEWLRRARLLQAQLIQRWAGLA